MILSRTEAMRIGVSDACGTRSSSRLQTSQGRRSQGPMAIVTYLEIALLRGDRLVIDNEARIVSIR
jgi:hypothetical protein